MVARQWQSCFEDSFTVRPVAHPSTTVGMSSRLGFTNRPGVNGTLYNQSRTIFSAALHLWFNCRLLEDGERFLVSESIRGNSPIRLWEFSTRHDTGTGSLRSPVGFPSIAKRKETPKTGFPKNTLIQEQEGTRWWPCGLFHCHKVNFQNRSIYASRPF